MYFCSGLERNGGAKYVYALFPVNAMKLCACVRACVRAPKAFWTTVWDILTEVEKTEHITPVDTLLSETFLNPIHTIGSCRECTETHKEL
jgi:hypothetical protein